MTPTERPVDARWGVNSSRFASISFAFCNGRSLESVTVTVMAVLFFHIEFTLLRIEGY